MYGWLYLCCRCPCRCSASILRHRKAGDIAMGEISAVFQTAINLIITLDFFQIMLLAFGLAVAGAFGLLELWKWIREARGIGRF